MLIIIALGIIQLTITKLNYKELENCSNNNPCDSLPGIVKTSVVMPAYNEASRISKVIRATTPYVDEILVIDDGSNDNTIDIATREGATVIRQNHMGYISALKRGFQESSNEIIITIDADGEHRASDIPNLVAPILSGNADLVIGIRNKIPRISERLITKLTRLKLKTGDACTGFRAIKKSLAMQLKLSGKCTCGIFTLEANSLGAKIMDIPVKVSDIDKPRSTAWHHFIQVFYIIAWLLKKG